MTLIDLDELKKFPIRLDHYDKEHGDEKYVFGVEAVFEYAEYLTKYTWVPCSKRLPEKSGMYLVYHENEDMFRCYFESGIDSDKESPFGYWEQHFDADTLGWCGEDWRPFEGVTHWMPLINPPEMEGDNEDEV